ncbi:MAG: hypothetical protein HON53_22205 [Planctomycetaceae bacterium]|jgi:glucose/arabinose dehydrogenase|nr:hypothetical protein [Planctomycetaceae bacterium]MBT6157878.1 hypothetical protein [Planctomycetaceae bacterium]MBT6487403.1 hypothetical protein [Planctomycetaceae bacterium]MBT6496005.1 hypothetical protein [Planctomycetaceae bacterium]
MLRIGILASVVLFSAATLLPAQEKPATEDDYYRLLTFTVPKGVVLEAGAFAFLPENKVVVSSRRGEIYLIENAYSKNPAKVTFKRYAHGLHEVLGLDYRDGWLYVTQRPEVSRIKDTTGDGKADLFETVNAGWDINGDYHEYAFGSKFDRDGNIWVTLCLTGSFNSNGKYRGWCVRITPDGELIPTCSGIRSPGGMGLNAAGDVFYTDNQGPWNGTCSLKHLKPGSFQGHPGGNKWFDLPEVKRVLKTRPQDPQSGSRIMIEADKIPEYVPPAVLFPYTKMGKSASGIACDVSGGKFGPFQKQMFVGDQSASTVMRCFLEKVDGRFQGACFPFRQGFASGTLPIEFGPDGSMFAGGTNRGWGSRGTKPFAVERMVWTGTVPFEVHEMRAKPDGFELTFTHPVDRKTAQSIESYKLTTYTYIYQASYGSPEVDHTTPTITKVTVADDGKSARLYIDGLQRGHVHELHLNGVRSAKKQPLLHQQAYYTLNNIPKK